MAGNIEQAIEKKLEEARRFAAKIQPEWEYGEFRREHNALSQKLSEIKSDLQSLSNQDYQSHVDKQLAEMEAEAEEKRYKEPEL